MAQDSFKPDGPAASVMVSATATASATAIPQGSGYQVRVVNEGTVPIRIGFGTASSAPATVSATAGISVIQAGTSIFTLDQTLMGQQGYIYVCAASATATVNVTRGSGS